jgi:hypothetical protein
MDAYDLVDTLVKINYNTGNIFTAITGANVIHRPKGNFIVITAQSDNPAIKATITRLVAAKFPECSRIYFVTGSEQAVIARKASVLKRIGATSFTDNNATILAGIHQLLPDLKLYRMTANGARVAY